LLVVESPGGLAFAEHTLRADLGDQWSGWLPWSPLDVDLLHRGAAVADRRLRRSVLVTAARDVLDGLAALEQPLLQSDAREEVAA
ncbi:MAG: hypothetical protein RI900_3427, partial [Actinomycetota bacterium]